MCVGPVVRTTTTREKTTETIVPFLALTKISRHVALNDKTPAEVTGIPLKSKRQVVGDHSERK